MCELFGVSTRGKVNVNGYLKEFFSHSNRNPNGWGIAFFYNNAVSLEKEPVIASKSVYLRERLRRMPEGSDMIAHIRLATRGGDEYTNSHPFVKRDNFGRVWTFAHNGTIFDYANANYCFKKQEGETDSERVIIYMVDRINEKQSVCGRALSFDERFSLIDEIVCDMAKGNKLNFLLYDGEVMYVHSNYANHLHSLKKCDSMIFATLPLSDEDWQPVPFTTLTAYAKGELIKTGSHHKKEYVDNDGDAGTLFIDYSFL